MCVLQRILLAAWLPAFCIAGERGPALEVPSTDILETAKVNDDSKTARAWSDYLRLVDKTLYPVAGDPSPRHGISIPADWLLRVKPGSDQSNATAPKYKHKYWYNRVRTIGRTNEAVYIITYSELHLDKADAWIAVKRLPYPSDTKPELIAKALEHDGKATAELGEICSRLHTDLRETGTELQAALAKPHGAGSALQMGWDHSFDEETSHTSAHMGYEITGAEPSVTTVQIRNEPADQVLPYVLELAKTFKLEVEAPALKPGQSLDPVNFDYSFVDHVEGIRALADALHLNCECKDGKIILKK